jgi:hypothetical protein
MNLYYYNDSIDSVFMPISIVFTKSIIIEAGWKTKCLTVDIIF